MDDITQVLNDPIQRRLAIRVVLALGILVGVVVGLLAPWPWAVLVVSSILLTFVYRTYRDIQTDAHPTEDSSEDSI